MKNKIVLYAFGLLSLAVLFSGCTMYTGIAVKDKKAIISVNDASSVVCDIGSDGMLSNCKNN